MYGRYPMFLTYLAVYVTTGCGSGGPSDQNASTGGGGGEIESGGTSGSDGNLRAGGNPGQSATGGQGETETGGTGAISNTAGIGGAPNTGGVGQNTGGTGPSTPGVTLPRDGDRSIGPTYVAARESRSAAGVPRGQTVNFVMNGKESTIFPGDYVRSGAIYVPSQYIKGTPAPFIVLQDGGYPFTNPFTPTLDTIRNTIDNLIHEKMIPPVVVVFAGNRSGDENTNQRNHEYLTFSSQYADWVVKELLPSAETATATSLPDQTVTLSKAPQAGAAAGCSSGGAAAFGLAWWRPDRFGRAISYSGTFHSGQYASAINGTTPIKPVRTWLEAGTRDDSGTADANRRMASSLKPKGYKYHFDLAANATHCDVRAVTSTFPEAMRWIWSDLAPAQ
jgi:iron(III)-enterobactin esterase